MNRFSRHFFSSLFFFIVLIIVVGCSTSEKTITDEGDTEQETTLDEDLSDLQQVLAENRSKLSDVHITLNHDMPNIFLEKDSSNVSLNTDPFDGYRVQIMSTKNQPLADSVASAFRTWADSTIQGYTADDYVFFRQPFYKVHVGDFQKREQANNFSKLIKHRYPDAWVVHDRIDPSNVPADTASFSYKSANDLD